MSTKPKKTPPKKQKTQHLAAVPADDSPARTATEIKLWQALANHPGATTADLADHAAIGASTAGKILPRWQQAGHVTRSPGQHSGGNRRPPGTWAIAQDAAAPTAAQPKPPGESAPGTPERNGQRRVTNISGGRADGPAANSKGGRKLRSGELHGQVEDFLREPERAGRDYTPGDIARVLTRSSGAVYNCLRKLDQHGVVEQTSDKPRRYRLTDAATDG